MKSRAILIGTGVGLTAALSVAVHARPNPAPAPSIIRTIATNPAADQCAMGLPADSRMIYDASVRNMKSLDTLRDTVFAETRSLVMSGKITEADARPAAERAGTCLRLLASR